MKNFVRKILINRNWKVRSLQIINHMGFFYAFTIGTVEFWISSFLFYFLFFCIGINIGAHRYFSHRSFKTFKPLEVIFTALMTFATVGSLLSWVGMHRMHHKYSDTPKDPHTPIRRGKVSLTGFILSYLGAWDKYFAEVKYIQDLRKSRLCKIFHYYYLGFILFFVFLLSVMGLKYVIFLYCVPAVFCFHSASMIVSYGHSFGANAKGLNDSCHAKNSVLLHFLTLGEGVHGEHHKYPGKARYKENLPWYLFDLPGFLIEVLFARKA